MKEDSGRKYNTTNIHNDCEQILYIKTKPDVLQRVYTYYISFESNRYLKSNV